MARPPIDLKNPARAGLLAWLVPGLGHIYQGRTGKGVLYAVCILGLYLVGLVLGEGKVVYWGWINPMRHPEEFRLSSVGQLGVGLPALLSLLQGTLQYYGMDPLFGGFMAEPKLEVLNGLHPRLGKFLEIGTLYTVMAGLLNVLAIYDAYAGPALSDDETSNETTAEAKASARGAEARA